MVEMGVERRNHNPEDIMAKKTFQEFMREVDSILESKCGMCHRDLADYCYRDAYDNGKSAKSTASAALRAQD